MRAILQLNILSLLFILPSIMFAQPANDECASPTPLSLTIGSPTSMIQDITTATQSLTTPSCESNPFTDVWYSFTMPVNGNVYIDGGFFDRFALYDACAGNELACFIDKGYLYSLTSGTSYMLRGWRREASPGSINFTIQPFAEASNDECANPTPISLTVGIPTSIVQEVQGSTQSPSNPSCEGGSFTDVWYSFTMPVDGNVYIDGGFFDRFALYDACAGTELACFIDKGYLYSLTSGTTYILRGWHGEASPGSINFTIQPFAEASNDECANPTPISLTIGTPTSIVQEVQGSTQSPTSPSCEGSSFTDVWYSFTMPVNGNVYIDGGFFDRFALYDACAGNELSCFIDKGYLYSLTAGTSYLLRGWRRETFSGSINFTIQPFAEAGNDECANPTPLTLTIGASTSIVQEIQGSTQSPTTPSCETTSFTDVWYSFTMPVDGNVYIVGAFFDEFALYDGCGGNELSCTKTNGFLFSLTAGNTYILRCWRPIGFPGSINMVLEPFEQIPNDICATAEPISVSTVCSGTTNSIELRGATQSSSTPNCDGSPMTDGWFVFEAPIDGDIFVKNTTGLTKFAFYDGCPITQGDLDNPLACFSSNGTLSGVTFGQTIYLQVFRRQINTAQTSFCLEGAYAVADPGALSCSSATTTIDNSNNLTWVPILDGNGQLVASIKANGENLGVVTADIYVENNDVSTYIGQPFLRRKVSITPTTQPSNPVSVRLYILQDELNDLVLADPNLGHISQLEVVKNSQSDCTAAYDGTGDFIAASGQPYGNDYYIQYNVGSFSSFFPSSVSLAPLPVELVRFTGNSVKGENQLNWITASEKNSSHFVIEHSIDGLHWEAIGQVKAMGNTQLESAYHFGHNVQARLSYYRLKMVDFDEKFEYSNIISLTESKLAGVRIAPNPAKEQIQLNTTQPIHQTEIMDVYGRILSEKTGRDIQTLDVSSLKTGIYFLRINQNRVVRFSKI